jgi:hypothetical protein
LLKNLVGKINFKIILRITEVLELHRLSVLLEFRAGKESCKTAIGTINKEHTRSDGTNPVLNERHVKSKYMGL